MLGSSKYDKYGKNNEKDLSSLFRPVGPLKRAKTCVKNCEDEMLFEFHQKFILGSSKYVEYGKNNEKDPSSLFRPVGP